MLTIRHMTLLVGGGGGGGGGGGLQNRLNYKVPLRWKNVFKIKHSLPLTNFLNFGELIIW